MKTKFLLYLALTSLLSGGPLFSMDVSTDEETQSDTEHNIDEQSDSHWGIGSFFASQVAGASELLGYGRRATGDLLLLVRQVNTIDARDEMITQADSHEPESVLVALFLNNDAGYKEFTRFLPRDMNSFIARCLLRDHPMVKLIRKKLVKPCLLLTLEGHSQQVESAQFNNAGNRIATASFDGTAKIWDPASGVCLKTLIGHSYLVTSAKFNITGDRIVTGSYDGTAKIWDVDSGKCLRTLQDQRDNYVLCAQFNEPGDRIVTAHWDSAVKIWDVDSGVCLRTLQGHSDQVKSVQFNRAGDKIVTASKDGTAKIWDAASGICLHTLDYHGGEVNSAQFNSTGNKVVTASRGGLVKIWNTTSGLSLRRFQPLGSWVLAAEFNAAGDRIVTGSYDGMAIIWDVNSGTCLHTLQGTGNPVNSAQFNGAGDRIVTASDDRTAKIWSVNGLLDATNWLEENCTLEQALLLHCVYETCITHVLMKKRDPSARLIFDFNLCPHLQEYFTTMPAEVQACLQPFVKKITISETSKQQEQALSNPREDK